MVHIITLRLYIFCLYEKNNYSRLGRYAFLNDIYIATDPTPVNVYHAVHAAMSLCAHNVYSANHNSPPTLFDQLNRSI